MTSTKFPKNIPTENPWVLLPSTNFYTRDAPYSSIMEEQNAENFLVRKCTHKVFLGITQLKLNIDSKT